MSPVKCVTKSLRWRHHLIRFFFTFTYYFTAESVSARFQRHCNNDKQIFSAAHTEPNLTCLLFLKNAFVPRLITQAFSNVNIFMSADENVMVSGSFNFCLTKSNSKYQCTLYITELIQTNPIYFIS